MSDRATPYQPRRDDPPPPDPTSPDALQAARKRRIGERAKALMAAGYYPREDVEMIASWVRGATFTLVEIERLIKMAEDDYTANFIERPMVARRATIAAPAR